MKIVVKIFISTYIVASLLALIVGVADGSEPRLRYLCNTPHSRITTFTGLKYIYKLGCYLGEPSV